MNSAQTQRDNRSGTPDRSRNEEQRHAAPDDTVILGSRNILANPDLTDFDSDGSLLYWDLGCPPSPDGWDVYARQVNKITASGRVAVNGVFARQNLSKLSFEASSWTQDEPLLSGAPLPTTVGEALLAPPPEPPVVTLATRGGALGFPAGTYWVAFAWILGNPHTSMRITYAGPATQVTVAQGQRITIPPPSSSPPQGVGGIAVLLSAPNGDKSTLTLQERIDIRRAIPNPIVVRGPYQKGRLSVTATGANGTASPYNSLAPPRWWYANTPGKTLQKMTVSLSYQLVFGQGTSASQQQVRVTTTQRVGVGVEWAPTVHPEGATGWIPEFSGADGKTYTLSQRPLKDSAQIHTNDVTDKKNFLQSATAGDRQRTDTSSVSGPDAPPDQPTSAGAASLPPGDYEIRETFTASGKQSAPGPSTTVTLRDSGLAGGGAATGVSDQIFRVAAPSKQKAPNARFLDRSPVADQALDWTAGTAHVTVTTGAGILTMDDASGLTTEEDVHVGTPVVIDTTKLYTLRHKVALSRASGGMFRVYLAFYNSAGTQISRARLSETTDTTPKTIARTIGPARSKAQTYFPAGTVSIGFVFASVGSNYLGQSSARNLFATVSHIALFSGSHNRKRWPLNMGLTDSSETTQVGVPGTEVEANPYPAGAYCKVVQGPDTPSGPFYTYPTLLFAEDFEDGVIHEQTYASGGATVGLDPSAAVHGTQGLLLSDTMTGSVSSAYVYQAYGPRTTLARRFFMVFKGTWNASTSNVPFTRITRSSDPSDYLAELTRDGLGNVWLHARNGATDATMLVARGVLAGSKVKGEIVGAGGGTSLGQATCVLYVDGKRQPVATLQSLDWGGMSPNMMISGPIGCPATETFEIALDDIFDSGTGEQEGLPLPGNYIEYYAPEGTPASAFNLMRFKEGMKLPVLAGRDVCFSFYAYHENCLTPSYPLAMSIYDANGNVITRVASPVPSYGLIGDGWWKRYWTHFVTPSDAAYIVFEGGLVADGTIRVMALQFEYATIPTDFINTNATSGFLSVVFNTALPGGDPTDGPLEEIIRFLEVGAVETEQFDGSGNQLTSVGVQIRAADSPDELPALGYSPDLPTLLASVGMRRFVEVGVTLSTTDATRSPELRGIHLDTERAEPMFLDASGADYPSGVQILGAPEPSEVDTIVQKTYANAQIGFEDTSRGATVPRTIEGITLRAFRNSTVRALTEDRRTVGEFVAEIRHTRYRVRLATQPKWAVNRSVHSELPGEDFFTGDEDGFWIHEAQGLTALVVSEEDLG